MLEKARPAIFIFTFVLAMVTLGTAQSGEKEVHIGIKGGFSLPNLVGGDEQEITRDYKSRFAPNFGGYVEFDATRNVAIQAGIDYAPQGGKRNGIQPITAPIPLLPPLPAGQYYYGDFENTAKLEYLEFPVLGKYTWRRGRSVQPYVNAGPYVGVLLKATQVTRGSSTIFADRNGTPILIPPVNQPLPPIPFDAETDVTDSLNRANFGLTGGGGLKFPTKGNYWFLDVRASYGLTTLQKDTANDGKSRTGNLVVSVGFAFKIKGR
ncbi:MAG TPA: porin family protein [Pyrinomonadaceae bacterium]|nr:porin family protein [Pyrinomonadaceae bacterium]